MAFLASNDFEDAVRKAVSLGGGQRYARLHRRRRGPGTLRGRSEPVKKEVFRRLDEPLTQVVQKFCIRFGCG